MNPRINNLFLNNKKKLVTFITGGDPTFDISTKILNSIALNGADIIEIGMPFSDPMADGPTIQLSSSRAIKQGIDLDKIFSMCNTFRNSNNYTPLVLMGYYNVIFHYGVKKFVACCKKNGVDGLIVVDLQPEEDKELLDELNLTNIDLIRLITPTTNSERLKTILKNSSGFLYYVTITGITGQHSANINELQNSIDKIKKITSLPIVSGFGIKNAIDVKKVCQFCEGAVVGSSIVKIIEDNLKNTDEIISKISKFVKDLKEGIEK